MASPTLNLVFLITLTAFFALTLASQPLDVLCSNTNYTSQSSYGANLNRLLSSLPSTPPLSSGFYNVSYGRNSSTANALGLCRGDVNPRVCRSCISNATTELSRGCPNRKAGLIWYDECMLRYTNRSIFGKLETKPSIMLYNTNNVSDPSQFNQVVRNLLDSLRKQAISGDSMRKFATRDAVSSNLPRVYGLVQCTPDLNSTQCDDCLNQIINDLPQCCDGKQGGRILCPSCNFRYEIEQFYEGSSSAEAPSPTLGPAPPPSSGSEGVPPPAPSGSSTPTQPVGANNGPSASSPPPPSAASTRGNMNCGILAVFVLLLVF